MCPARRPFWSIGILVVAVVLTAMLGAVAAAQVATLGSPAPSAPAGPAAPLTDGQDALLAWASCMRENGVEMDDPRFGVDGALIGGLGKDGQGTKADPESEVYQLATQVCSDLLTAFKAPPDAAEQAERTDQLLAWAGCMRDQGVDMPDPQADGSYANYDWKVDLKGESYIEADEVCRTQPGGPVGK
jgi:hypothetical protein